MDCGNELSSPGHTDRWKRYRRKREVEHCELSMAISAEQTLVAQGYFPALYVCEILGKLFIVVTVSYIVVEHESPKLYAKKTVSLAEKGLLLDGVHPKYVSLLIEIVEFSQI